MVMDMLMEYKKGSALSNPKGLCPFKPKRALPFQTRLRLVRRWGTKPPAEPPGGPPTPNYPTF